MSVETFLTEASQVCEREQLNNDFYSMVVSLAGTWEPVASEAMEDHFFNYYINREVQPRFTTEWWTGRYKGIVFNSMEDGDQRIGTLTIRRNPRLYDLENPLFRGARVTLEEGNVSTNGTILPARVNEVYMEPKGEGVRILDPRTGKEAADEDVRRLLVAMRTAIPLPLSEDPASI